MQPVTSSADITPLHASHNSSPDRTHHKVAYLVLELFAKIMPTLLQINQTIRSSHNNTKEEFLSSSHLEQTQHNRAAWIALVGISQALPVAEEYKKIIQAVTGGNTFIQGMVTQAQTQKSLIQQALSSLDQERSSLQSTLDKILQLIQQILQTERAHT